MNCVLLLKWIKFSVKKIKHKKYWKSPGKVGEFCQSGKVGTLVLSKLKGNDFAIFLITG